MNDSKGINISEMKNISKKFINYRKEINKIFLEYKRVIDTTNTYFLGEVADEYRKKFTDFYNKLGIVLESFTEFSNSISDVVSIYQNLDDEAAKFLNNKLIDTIK